MRHAESWAPRVCSSILQPLPIMTIRVRRSSIEQGRESPAMRQKRVKSFSTLHHHRSGAGGGGTSSAADVKGFAASHAANRPRSINSARVVQGYVVIAEPHHQQYTYLLCIGDLLYIIIMSL